MQKISYFLIATIFSMLFSINVIAATTNGVPTYSGSYEYGKDEFNLVCSYYNGDTIVIDKTNGKANISPSTMPFQSPLDSILKQYHFMNADGSIDCPLYIYGEPSQTGGALQKIVGFSNEDQGHLPVFSNYVFVQLNASDSECRGICQGNHWSCEYTGREGTLTTKYDGLYLIYYPDGTFTEVDAKDVSSNCADIYYNRVTKEIRYSTTNNSSNNNQYLCDNRNNIDYYCVGDCKFPNNAKIDCYDRDTGTHPDTSQGESRNPMYEDGPLSEICANEKIQSTLKFLGYLLIVVKIVIPALLILFGTIDFGKALAASKDDGISKAAKMLIIRIICGLVIFFIPTIVNLVFNIVGHGNTSYNECRICVFQPNLCGKGR